MIIFKCEFATLFLDECFQVWAYEVIYGQLFLGVSLWSYLWMIVFSTDVKAALIQFSGRLFPALYSHLKVASPYLPTSIESLSSFYVCVVLPLIYTLFICVFCFLLRIYCSFCLLFFLLLFVVPPLMYLLFFLLCVCCFSSCVFVVFPLVCLLFFLLCICCFSSYVCVVFPLVIFPLTYLLFFFLCICFSCYVLVLFPLMYFFSFFSFVSVFVLFPAYIIVLFTSYVVFMWHLSSVK